MKKYFLDIHKKSFFSYFRHNASAKPRTDAIKIAEKCGFKEKVFYTDEFPIKWIEANHPGFKNRILGYKMRWFVNHTHNSVILVQMPFLHFSLNEVLATLKAQDNKIVILAHDIEKIRCLEGGVEQDMKTLSLADQIIVHTPQMAEAAKNIGLVQPMKILNFFDYLNEYKSTIHVIRDHFKIIFAGDFDRKSTFVRKLDKVKDRNKYQYYIYGKNANFDFHDNVIYKGFFDSEDIQGVEGDWGLVWDGDDINTCSGPLGNYLTINAPFKFSLYLALGKPVIVWSKSAMANYVIQYHLGICIESLDDIYETISRLTNEEVQLIEEGVMMYSAKVRNGHMLEDVLNNV